MKQTQFHWQIVLEFWSQTCAVMTAWLLLILIFLHVSLLRQSVSIIDAGNFVLFLPWRMVFLKQRIKWFRFHATFVCHLLLMLHPAIMDLALEDLVRYCKTSSSVRADEILVFHNEACSHLNFGQISLDYFSSNSSHFDKHELFQFSKTLSRIYWQGNFTIITISVLAPEWSVPSLMTNFCLWFVPWILGTHY